jgi:hypothetical protein
MVTSTSETAENSSKKTFHLILKITLETLKLPKIKTAKHQEEKYQTIPKVPAKRPAKNNKRKLRKQSTKTNHQGR